MDMRSIRPGDAGVFRSRATGLAAVVVAVLGGVAMAAPTVIDFEDLAPGTAVTAQYGAQGVLFQNHYLDTHPAAHSGTHVLRSASLSEEIFTPIPIAMTFTAAQARVKLFAASTGIELNGTLTAYDAADNVVASDGPKPVAVDVFSAMFEVIDSDTTPSITRAELRLENGIYFAIDDLEFEGEPPAPPPPTPPVVQITSPANGVEVDTTAIDITGTVTGEGLLSPATLTILFARPPGSTAPPFTSVLSLTGTGTTLQFAQLGFGVLPMGPITVTVTAQNFAGQQGSASVSFINLPPPLRIESLGSLLYVLGSRACPVAVYEGGALGLDSAGQTHTIGGAILDKLLTIPAYLQDNLLHELPFSECPLGDEREGPGGSRVQDFGVRINPNDPADFDGVRIYSHPTIGTFFVPSVFAMAIDKNDGEEATGIPNMDPISSPGEMKTYLFQRFTRPNPPLLVPRVDSTLEIRGTPPLLWIERQGGSLDYPRDVNFSATLWESFRCSGQLGPCELAPPEGTPLWESTPCRCTQEPCAIEPPFPPPGPSAPIDMTGDNDRFCYGTVYADCDAEAIPPSAGCTFTGVPEWSAILGNLDDWPTERTGNHTSTPLFGLAIESAMAGEDNPFSHEYHYGPERSFASDWNVAIFPLGPQRGIAPHTSFVAGNTYVELEYESTYANVPHIFMDWPFMGDLFFAAGRWIIDCGHGPPTGDPYRSELHPIFMYAKMKSEMYLGRPATRCDIWVNGWYPGDPIEFDIFPPPRPSPDAILVAHKPVDEDAAWNVDLEYCFTPAEASNHAHIRFTGQFRDNHIEDNGEMIWQTRRAYMGQWYLFWSD